MTFTLVIPFDDIARVRMAIGDTDAAAHRFEDELIQALIDEEGSWQGAALTCIDVVIAELSSTPSFSADWLRVDVGSPLKHYAELRSRLAARYADVANADTGGLVGGVVAPTRGDRDVD